MFVLKISGVQKLVMFRTWNTKFAENLLCSGGCKATIGYGLSF